MWISVLGELHVRTETADVAVGGARPRRALALLAAEANRPVTVDRLVDFVWDGAPPPSAGNSLQSHLSRVRSALGTDRIRRTPGGYQLDSGPEQLDALRFEELFREAALLRRTGHPADAVQVLDRALGLWSGPAFGDLGRHAALRDRAEQLERLRADARRDRAECLLDAGRHHEVVPDLERLTSAEPFDEALCALRARALYRAGRQADALAAISSLRRRLVDELGVDPGPELVVLEEQILRQDPALVGTTAAPEAARPLPAHTTPFVGREQELATVTAALVDGLAGTGRLVLVAGDPGIGKTRLAEEVVANAVEYDVVTGACYDDEVVTSYGPWLRAIATTDLSPAWERLAQESDDPAAASALHRAASVRPLLVVLDDLHWADEASVRLLELLSRDVAASRLVVLALYRDAEVDGGHPLQRVLGDLGRRSSTVRVALSGLDRTAVATYVDQRTDSQPEEWLVDRLMTATSGNPFLLQETVAALMEQGDLAALTVDRPWPLPLGVRELTAHRLARLPSTTVEVLEAAALAGPAPDPAQLGRALGRAPLEVLAALEPAGTTRLLRYDEGDRPEFVHALVRDAIVAQVPPARSLALHRALGEALLGPSLLDDPTLARAANHLSRAAVLGPDVAADAVAVLRQCGDRASARARHADAAADYRRSADLAALAGTGPVEHADLLVSLGDALRRSSGFADAAEAYGAAAELARDRDAGTLARAALGHEECALHGRRPRSGRTDPSITLLERALAAQPEDVVETRVQLMAALGRALSFAGVAPRAAEVAGAAVAAADAAARDDLVATALIARHLQAGGPGRLRERIRDASAAAAAADRAGTTGLALEARRLLVPDLFRAGRLDRAVAVAGEVEHHAERAGDDAYRWHVPMWRAATAIGVGRLDEAELLVARFKAAGEHYGYADVARVHVVQLMLLRVTQGRVDDAWDEVEAVAAGDPFEPWPMARTWLDAAAGKWDRAQRWFVELSARRFRLSQPFAGVQVFMAAFLAEPCLKLGAPDDARALSDILAPARGQNLVIGSGAAMLGDAAHYLGVLAAHLGERATAGRLLAQARDNNETWGLLPAAQRSADMLVELGLDADDREGHR